MRFDWTNFFRSVGVPYVTEGKNTKAGHTNIKCPFCGSLDPSQHMGCDPESGAWGCWRNKEHRGKHPAKLIQAVKGCLWTEAVEIAGGTEIAAGPESLEELEEQASRIDRLPRKHRARFLRMPPEFRRIDNRSVMRLYWNYLAGRYFREDDIEELCKYYSLRGAISGDWNKRLILPFFYDREHLIGWQGRAVGKSASLRYISHPESNVTKQFLFNRGKVLGGGKTLVIVEGPIDCLKVDFYGKDKGIRAVATLGTAFVDAQVNQIYRLAPLFNRITILFDPEALSESLDLHSRLSSFDVTIGEIPSHREDAGDLRPKEVVSAILDQA